MISKRLFQTDLPKRQWLRFSSEGFRDPVVGVIYDLDKTPCCGLPLGGIGTGCIDLDAAGVYGLSSIFNPVSQFPYQKDWRMPRKPPSCQPVLGLWTGGSTWVLADEKYVVGGKIQCCTEPYYFGDWTGQGKPTNAVACKRIDGVKPADDILYYGHYPIADVEYFIDAPLSIGMRAWSSFIPGDAAASNIPAAVFEVHVRNTSDEVQEGTIAFNFPGPDSQEASATEFSRREICEDFKGVMVSSASGVNYCLGTIGDDTPRTGGCLGTTPSAWSKIRSELPSIPYREDRGTRLYQSSGSSAAVDFRLDAQKEKVIRFLLTWYAPVWEGAENEVAPVESLHQFGTRWYGNKWQKNNYYTHMYAARYNSSLDIARRMAEDHQSLLERIIRWQSVVYSEQRLPEWLRDSLINILALIPEDSVWAQAKPPLGDWCYPGGLFALNESPRGCPDLECIPCSWYGNQPIVFFFPELARSTLKAYMRYQREDGAAPFWLGKMGDLPDLATPSYDWQISLNGTCYVDLVDRVWQRTGDDSVLYEFYESVKECNTFTMNLRRGPGGVISMPEGNVGMEWFEHGEWAGMCAHLGLLRLAQLKIMERMARHMGDDAYVEECQRWFADGLRAMEEELWTGEYYLNFYDKEQGKLSDDVMAYQLDGEWMAEFHGVSPILDPDRVKRTLQTIRRCNIALTPDIGAANFAKPDGSPLPQDSEVAKYGQYSMFTPEVLILAMNYISAGEYEFGIEFARKFWSNLVLEQCHPFDMPNVVRGSDGKRLFGTDYYQCMMLWSLPANIMGTDIMGFCGPQGLVDRIIEAARGRTDSTP